ncbi:unnamed protein product, partial [Sphacelaria rigidula]
LYLSLQDARHSGRSIVTGPLLFGLQTRGHLLIFSRPRRTFFAQHFFNCPFPSPGNIFFWGDFFVLLIFAGPAEGGAPGCVPSTCLADDNAPYTILPTNIQKQKAGCRLAGGCEN